MGKIVKKQLTRWQRILFMSFLIVVAAQININLFVHNFKISIAIILIPVFLFLLEDVPLLSVTLISAAGVFCSRILSYWFQNGSVSSIYQTFLPELLFYLTYGVLMIAYSAHKRNVFTKNGYIVPLFLMDYLSNLVELVFRLQFDAFNPKAQLSILLVALVRTALIWMILTALDRYRFTLLSRAHAERYHRLMLLISTLSGEVLWMQKNTSLIEETMSTSYALFHKLQEEQTSPELASCALSVAKDVHEIKKEYFLIIRGLSDAMHKEFQDTSMSLSDLFLILKKAACTDAAAVGKEIIFSIQCDRLLYTDKHYLLMSVFQNLFSNSLEASSSSVLHIHITQDTTAECCTFTIRDDGPGISSEYISQVFDAGFSTKIDYATGTINRGLGLNIVKDIIEDHFSGQIHLTSVPGDTAFTISIPIMNLEVTQP